MSINTKLSVAASVLAIATIGTAFGTTASAEETKTDTSAVTTVDTTSQEAINEKAKHVILGIDDKGTLVPTGQARIEYLEGLKFDAKAVQNKVNELLNVVTVEVPVSAVTVEQAPVVEQTIQEPAPATYTGGTDVNSVAQQMAARTGVSAEQWLDVIFRESGNNPNAMNASSGAYGYFQLLGHGEYPGMSVQEQIDMAVAVYQSQGAGAWVAW